MPILQMRKELVGGSIFALDIGKTVEKDRFKSHGFTRSGWRILWNSIKRLVPFIRKKQERRDNPNIFYLLFQTTILGSDYAHRKHQNLNEADVILDFKDTPVKTTDFNLKEKTARKMINEGYEKGLKKVLEIKNDPELKKLFFR